MSKELKKLRIDFDVTQEDLAKMLGISKSTYCRKENGAIKFLPSEIKFLKKFYNLSSDQVYNIFFA